MFVDLPEAPSLDRDPLWSEPIEQRLATLLSRRRRIAWVYERPDTSTFRYRASNMVEAVNADPLQRASATWFGGDELSDLIPLIPKLDAIVVARYCFDANLRDVLERARRTGVRTVFDSDDLVFSVDYAPLVMDTLAADVRSSDVWNYWYSYMGRLSTSAHHCDAGLTTNSYLQALMKESCGTRAVSVVPNFLNRDQQHYSMRLLDAKRAGKWRRDGNVTIGYFSGTPSHKRDFEVVVPALIRMLTANADVRLRLVGYLDQSGPLGKFKDRIEVLPFMDFVSLQRAIAEVEINIAPLQHNVFTNCKSELKFFEAAAVGTWTVASPTHAFREAIEDGQTGRLARAHEWDAALQEAVDMARDGNAYQQKAEAAAAFAHRTYGWNLLGSAIVEAVLPSAH